MESTLKKIDRLKYHQKRLDSEKTSFFSHITHGIRTPLNAIMGFSKLLNSYKSTDETQRKYIRGILNGSNMLLQFVDNVIDLSQLENESSLNITSFNLNQFIWNYVENYYDQQSEDPSKETKIMLVWDSKDEDLCIKSDKDMLHKSIRLMQNLLEQKYNVTEFDLGYSIVTKDKIKIFLKPIFEHNLITQDIYKFYEIDKENSFELFNYRVLEKLINQLGGEFDLFGQNNESSIYLPIQIVKL